ncbi:MarR family transcriptional regulator [Streptomyces sp. SID13031]|uniref:MarR family winged helix-turn-helix transcriptional regulator n=1 Tax=Streptomyces sp. SID13031 TaxID=2706046 RepID=UPI0013C833B3|nr:MarR family transcriptional regulator [Streptomyces sp. SID13031]NEA31553.1 MarR family transcriptional regulator [Streptomyces sp. SID13031]
MEASVQEIGVAVKRLQWLHHTEASKQLADLGVSLPQWDVLRRLHEVPDASLHDLAQLTFQTDQSMGSLATRMIARGLIERLEGPGRAIRHRLTPEGERIREEGAELFAAVLTASVGSLSPTERSTLLKLLTKALG